MAWPTTPATTTHLDAGTDDPNLARPQIKQNVDNVNAIIDEFGDVSITTPSDGQLLQYNASNSRWENADAASSGGGAGSTGALATLGSDSWSATSVTASGITAIGIYAINYEHMTTNKIIDQVIVNDPTATSNQVNENSRRWTFASTGTYDIRFIGSIEHAFANGYLVIYNITQNSITTQLIGSTDDRQSNYNSVTVNNTTDEYCIIYYNTANNYASGLQTRGWILEIIKTS